MAFPPGATALGSIRPFQVRCESCGWNVPILIAAGSTPLGDEFNFAMLDGTGGKPVSPGGNGGTPDGGGGGRFEAGNDDGGAGETDEIAAAGGARSGSFIATAPSFAVKG